MDCRDDEGDYYCRTDSEVRAMFEEVNRIYRQAGMRFTVQNVAYTNREEYLNLEREGNTYQHVYEICDIATDTGGLEVYFINLIDGGHISAFNQPRLNTGIHGIIASTNATGVTLAHEIGHSCGLKDIYDDYPEKTSLHVTGNISKERLSDDWGTVSDTGYYCSFYLQTDLIRQLLMCGKGGTTKRDLPYGDVYGLGTESEAWFLDKITVGLPASTKEDKRTPVHF